MSTKTPLTPFSRIMIGLIAVVGVFFAGKYALKSGLFAKLAPQSKEATSSSTSLKSLFGGGSSGSSKSDDCIKIGVVTWGGYAGGQLFNNGFDCSENSRYFTEYGIKVGFKLIDPFEPSRAAFKSNDIQGLWSTIDAEPTEAQEITGNEGAKVVFQVDKSRGGDAIVVRRGINSAADLKGKKIALALMTHSNTFLLWLLEANNMRLSDIEIVKKEDASKAADDFKAGAVDAAVVWSPDDEACVKAVTGSKVLVNTKSASDIIYDVMIFSGDILASRHDAIKSIVAGWLRGSAEINTDPEAKAKAAKILAAGLGQPESFCLNAINNVRLTTLGDNINFFNLNGDYAGVKGQDLYDKMSRVYSGLGYITGTVPSFHDVTDQSIIRELLNDPKLQGPEQAAESKVTFKPASKSLASAQAFSSNKVKINFPTGSAMLDDNMKTIIDGQFVQLAKGFARSRIRVEGNTDNVGSAATNRSLSKKRAVAVVVYLENQYQFDANRFVVVGNGPDKPVCTDDSEDCRAQNRRTDFEFIAN